MAAGLTFQPSVDLSFYFIHYLGTTEALILKERCAESCKLNQTDSLPASCDVTFELSDQLTSAQQVRRYERRTGFSLLSHRLDSLRHIAKVRIVIVLPLTSPLLGR